MAAPLLETPSRVWRRIEAIEGRDMPSLPSVPGFDESTESTEGGDSSIPLCKDGDDDAIDLLGDAPIHSTPATVSSHTTTIHGASRTNSTARFATSIASRSTKSAMSNSRSTSTKEFHPDSFDVSMIPSLPDIHRSGNAEYTDMESVCLPRGAHDESGGYGDIVCHSETYNSS